MTASWHDIDMQVSFWQACEGCKDVALSLTCVREDTPQRLFWISIQDKKVEPSFQKTLALDILCLTCGYRTDMDVRATRPAMQCTSLKRRGCAVTYRRQ